jgi:hypothetical protein
MRGPARADSRIGGICFSGVKRVGTSGTKTSSASGSGRRVAVAAVAAAALVAGGFGVSLALRGLPVCRMDVVKSRRLILYRLAEGEAPPAAKERTRAHRLVLVNAPPPRTLSGGADPWPYAQYLDLSGRDALPAALRRGVVLLSGEPRKRVVIAYRGGDTGHAGLLAAYRVAHDGWTAADALAEARARLGGRRMDAELEGAVRALAAERGCTGLDAAPGEAAPEEQEEPEDG